MNVLSVASPFAPVRPDIAGGAEQLLSILEAELVGRGHRSRVIAARGSRVAGRLSPIPAPGGLIGEDDRRSARQAIDAALRDALGREAVDVVHLHGPDFPEHRAALRDGPPAVVTLHLPPALYRCEAFAPDRPERLVCVSEAQRRTCPPEAGSPRVIVNGVPDRLREVRVRRRGFALSLGRICPEQGHEQALDACEAAGVPLWIGGRAWLREHEAYLRDVLLPRLRPPHRLLGPVGGPRKARLLASACCLVIASRVAEASSLAAMEALACGTPVAATAVGALPEVVDHGTTGFLALNARELAEGIARAGVIDAAACREEAARRFSARRMAEEYLALYAEQVAERAASRRVAS